MAELLSAVKGRLAIAFHAHVTCVAYNIYVERERKLPQEGGGQKSQWPNLQEECSTLALMSECENKKACVVALLGTG